MEVLIAIGLSALVLVLIFVVNHMRNKGMIDDRTFDLVDDFLIFLVIALRKNKKHDTVRIEKALEIIRNTLDFIGEQANMTLEERKTSAIDNIVESLKSIGIDVDNEIELLVKLIVNNAFNYVKTQ